MGEGISLFTGSLRTSRKESDCNELVRINSITSTVIIHDPVMRTLLLYCVILCYIICYIVWSNITDNQFSVLAIAAVFIWQSTNYLQCSIAMFIWQVNHRSVSVGRESSFIFFPQLILTLFISSPSNGLIKKYCTATATVRFVATCVALCRRATQKIITQCSGFLYYFYNFFVIREFVLNGNLIKLINVCIWLYEFRNICYSLFIISSKRVHLRRCCNFFPCGISGKWCFLRERSTFILNIASNFIYILNYK